MPFVWLNGELVEESAAAVSLRDKGLLHGAGVFTTMRAYGGRVFQLERHFRRLRDSCEALFVPLQHKDGVLADAAAACRYAGSSAKRSGTTGPDRRPGGWRRRTRTWSLPDMPLHLQ